MKVRFQADWDLNQRIVEAILRREPRIDFQTAHAAGLAGVDDPEVLAQTAKAGRILVTHDRKTMPRHFGDFITKHHCPGVIVVSQNLSIAQVAEALILIWVASEAEEWINTLQSLPW